MDTTLIVARQIFIMFLMMGLGAFLVKTKFVSEAFNLTLSKLLLNVVVPCLLINSFQMDYSPEVGKSLLTALGLSTVIQLLCILLARLIFGVRGDNQTRIAKLGMAYANCGFMGLPLLQAVLGNEGVFMASAFIIVFNIASWTHCYAVLRNTSVFDKSRPWYQAFMIPSIIAAVIGVILFYCPFRLPKVIQTSLGYMASTNTPLAMLVLGGLLAKLDFKKSLFDAKTLLALAGRLIICPLVCTILLTFLPISDTAKIAMMIISAMPMATGLSLQAAAYNEGGGPYASKLVAMSTLLSLITIPSMTLLCTFILSK